jgi:hypothetical protein
MATKKKLTATTSPSKKPAAKKKKTATTTPTKKPAPAKKTASASPTAATKTHGEDAPLLAAAQTLLASRSPISDVERDAFRSRAPDEICDALGVRTKSVGVARDALAWAKVIDATLRKAPAAVRPYSAPRFAWLLENVVALLDARAADRAAAKTASATRDGASGVEGAARAVRNDLLAMLDDLAGEAPADRAALDAARGGAHSREETAASLGALADLAAAWLARKDAAARALVAASGLAQGDVDRARAAAVALVSASSSTVLGGRVDARDTAAINRIEGRVLFELRAAMAAFAAANARDKTVPKLSPGAGTRAALSHGKPSAPGTDPATPATPAAPSA